VQPVWTLALNNPIVVPPVYDATRAFFAIDGDRLVAYDVMSGEQRWLVSARPVVEPAIGDGLIYVVEPESLTALRAGDGSRAWQVPLADEPAVPPVWDNGWLLVCTKAGQLLVFRGTDGQQMWRRDLEAPARARPALALDRIYAPTADGRVVALQVETGEPLWERRIGGAPNDVLALDERIFVGSTDHFFYCLLAKGGEIDWRWRTGADIIGRPIADGSRVYFVALDNVLRALNQKSGSQQWMRPLPLRPAWGPVAAGSTILVAGLTTSVRGFAMKDGAPAGEVAAAAEVATAPHAFEEGALHRPMLLVTTRDIAKGSGAALSARSFEPQIAPVSALPNLVQIAPSTPAVATPLRPR
jgi:outer membrane protein assembly factor BamB